MIPIRDTLQSETYPIVNYLLILINVLVYFVELSQGRELARFIFDYGLVPARYSVPQVAAYFSTREQMLSFLTFMFLHGGLLHLLGNMWFLYIFGDHVEDRLGHVRYLAFYLLCGLASGVFHVVLNWSSKIPTVGASGAIAGVMGAYFILHPRARILTLVPIFIFFYFVEIPAFLFLGVWFLFQFLSARGTPAQTGGVAWWAHIGGFVFGIVFLKVLEWIPKTGVQRRIRFLTRKRTSPKLQRIRSTGVAEDANLYGVMELTSREAGQGARKLINVRQGLRERNLLVAVPPGVLDGKILRLRGLGRRQPHGERGDLYLKVKIQG